MTRATIPAATCSEAAGNDTMTFSTTPVEQRTPPKPHLRLRFIRAGMSLGSPNGVPSVAPRDGWRVEREVKTAQYHGPIEVTAWWPTSRLALDAAYYQFCCEWPAGRP
jgi:hypothetical protein